MLLVIKKLGSLVRWSQPTAEAYEMLLVIKKLRSLVRWSQPTA